MFWIELFTTYAHFSMGFPGGSDGKESVLQCGTPGFDPWVRKIPWRRKWKPTPVFLPGEFHGQREPGGLHPMGSPRVRHDWATNTHTHTIFYIHSRQILPDPVNMCPFLGTSISSTASLTSYSQHVGPQWFDDDTKLPWHFISSLDILMYPSCVK